MYSIAILTILILLSWLRVARPGNSDVTGSIIYDARVPLLARLRMHGMASGTVVLGAMLLTAFWDLPWWGVVIAIGSVVALIALPIRYTLTTVGIQCGWTAFRRWTEFAGVSRAPGGARLQGVAGVKDMRIWLSGSLGDDEFVALLRRMIRGAYKGQNLLVDYPARPTVESPGNRAAASKVARTAI
ncbi:MAG TPA: hypothetical protein VD789_05220 [Thermomicrobiales bacterium]|nr:hypothetical protein [Thermomicrobiales bacterium]